MGAGGFALVDIGVKYALRATLTQDYEIWGHYLALRLRENEGIAFSLPLPHLITLVLTTGLVGGIVWWLFFREASLWQRVALMLVLGGAIGNLHDRIVFGHVIDYISVLSFPVFNLADSLITVGVVLFLLDEFLSRKKTHPGNNAGV